MTTVLAVRFPFGRYHATPWGRAVNESVPEWPPSPWRLLRCLYATWRWRAPDIEDVVATSLFQALADPPSFYLPTRSVGHTRHYMPGTGYTDDRAKVLDTFITLSGKSEVAVRWECHLADRQRDVLARLAGLVPYLGRAESTCEARLLPEEASADDLSGGEWCEPGVAVEGREAVRALCAEVPLDLEQLVASTTKIRDGGRTTPPGARWVTYWVPPVGGPVGSHQALRRRPPSRKPVTAVRLSLEAPARPSKYQAVAYADVLRADAVRRLIRKRPEGSITLSGRLGKPPETASHRSDGHVHAHYLVLDTDDDRLLDTAIVWAPEGLDDEELASLLSINRVSSEQPGFRRMRASAAGMGELVELVPETNLCPRGGAAKWRSLTPFVPYRHRKKETLEEFLQAEVSRELAARGLPDAEARPIRGNGDWLAYRRRRRLTDREERAFGVKLAFARPVPGPVVIGALSHFGLGLFEAKV